MTLLLPSANKVRRLGLLGSKWRLRPLVASATLMIASLVVSACATTSTLTTLPTQCSQNIGVGGSAAAFSLCTIASGVGASGQFPATTSGSATLGVTLTPSQPSSTTTLQSLRVRPESIGTTNVHPIAFLVFLSNATVAFGAYPQLTFTVLAGITAPNGYWLAFFDTSNPAGGWNVVGGPVQAPGYVVTFPGLAHSVTLTANVTYVFVLFAPSGTSPTPIPTPAPGAVLLSVSAMSFVGTGSANAQALTVSETNYSGTFTVTTAASGQPNSCSGIATVSPISGTGPFTVTPTGVGHCVSSVSGGNGQTAALTIDVSTTTLGGS